MSGATLAVDQLLAEDDSELLKPAAAEHRSASEQQRLRTLVETHHAFLWRSLRRLGVPEADVDDAAQQAWLVVARKLGSLVMGAEKGFVFAVALRVASAHRRSLARRNEVGVVEAGLEDPMPSADELLDRGRARALMDQILDGIPLEHRAVFVLYEIEEMTAPEIAQLLAIPLGTVASRLRRAREMFETRLARHKAQRGGSR